jgi:hypothetical protein
MVILHKRDIPQHAKQKIAHHCKITTTLLPVHCGFVMPSMPYLPGRHGMGSGTTDAAVQKYPASHRPEQSIDERPLSLPYFPAGQANFKPSMQ